MSIIGATAGELSARMERADVRCVEVVQAYLDEIASHDEQVNAFLLVDSDDALRQAAEIDRKRQAGETMGILAGLPVAVKDVVCTEGQRTTCGSRMLENFVPPYDGHAVTRLKQADAVLIGKTNMDEFAMGSSTENSAFKTTRNPWNLDHTPGGSSGGSAAAVAAGLVSLSLGSDTGGSIRQPASFCGVVGVKPTYGRVSRYGLVAFASSLDQIGPFTRTVRESAQVLETICGFDPLDSTSTEVGVEDWTGTLDQPARGLRIGVPKEYFVDGMDAAVHDKIQDAIATLEGLGCEVKQVSLPHTGYAVATYYLIATAEASSNLARYDGVRYGLRVEGATLQEMYRQTRMRGFGSEVKRRILLGTYALSTGYYDAYYLKAQKVRTLIIRDFQNAFEEVDLIVTPTCPTTAFKIGEKTDDPLSMYLSDIFTLTCNLAGLPGISIPCGKGSDGMPIGMQLLGNHFEEGKLLRVAHQFEQTGGFDS